MLFWKMLLFYTVISSIFIIMESKHYNTFMGPYTINLRRIQLCDERVNTTGFLDIHDVRTHRHQKPTFSGHFKFYLPLDEAVLVRLAVASWSNMGGWKENAHLGNFGPACHVYKYFPALWVEFFTIIGGEVRYCPFLPGLYRFVNLTVDPDKLAPTKVFFYGRWKVRVEFFTRAKKAPETLIMCWITFADTIPN